MVEYVGDKYYAAQVGIFGFGVPTIDVIRDVEKTANFIAHVKIDDESRRQHETLDDEAPCMTAHCPRQGKTGKEG